MLSKQSFCSDDYNVDEFFPAVGWKVLLAWCEDGEVTTSVSHVVAWAIAKYKEDPHDVEILPVIPHPFDYYGGFTWDYSPWGIASALIQPGENPSSQQMEFVKQYALKLEQESEAYHAACREARAMKRAGQSLEHIVETTGLSRGDASEICQQVEDQIRQEGGKQQ